MGCLAQGVGYILKGTNTVFFLAREKYQQIGERTSPMAKLFAITDPKRMNLNRQDLWQGETMSFFQERSVQKQQT